MGRRPDPVSWGYWGTDEVSAALVRHPEGSPAPAAPAPPISERHRTGWWRCVPVAHRAWDVEWMHAAGPGRGAFHATLFLGYRW